MRCTENHQQCLPQLFFKKNFHSSTVKRHQIHPGYPNQSRPSVTKFESAIRRIQQKLIKDSVARHQASAGHDWTGPTFVLFSGRFLFVTKSYYFWQFSFKDKQLTVECLFAGCTWTRARIAKECTSRVTSPASTRPLKKNKNEKHKINPTTTNFDTRIFSKK